MYRALLERYPYAHCELDFETPLQLLVATVLSAQTTDVMVNTVTPTLFSRWPTAEALAGADRDEMEARAAAHRLLPGQDELGHQRSAPRSSSGSTARCPGGSTTSSPSRASAARPRTSCWATRSASPASPSTPTSAGSCAGSAGPSETDPVKVEHAVGALFPKRDWTMLSHVLIFHGRRTCHARKPACGACPVARWCPSYGEGETDPVKAARACSPTSSRPGAVLPDPPPGPLPDDLPARPERPARCIR